MQGVLGSLIADLVANPAITRACSDNEEFWFRANDRFDICAGWMQREHCVQLSALLRAPGDAKVESACLALEAGAEGWHTTRSQDGDTLHAAFWHPATSTVAALSRASAHSLDAVRLSAFVQGFINRLLILDRIFNGAGGHDGN